MAKAYEDYFRPAAKQAQQSGLKKGDAPVRANRRERDNPGKTDKKAAAAVGMSERQLQRGKFIEKHGAPETIAAWKKGEHNTKNLAGYHPEK